MALAAAVLLAGPSAATVVVSACALVVLSLAPQRRGVLDLSATARLPELLRRVVPVVGISLAVAAALSSLAAAVEAGIWVTVTLVAARLVVDRAVVAARRRGHALRGTLVVGTGDVARRIFAVLRDRPEYGLRPLGYVERPAADAPPEWLGPLDDLGAIIAGHGAQVMVVAFGPTSEPDVVDVMRATDLSAVDAYVVPRFFELGLPAPRSGRELIWGIPLHPVRKPAATRPGWRVKCVADRVLAVLALVITAPAMAIGLVGVALTSPGPVLFRQRRAGRGGASFDLLKLRTLRPAPDTTKTPYPEQVITENQAVAVQVHQDVDVQRRETAVGRVLRMTSIDELPQLWNVALGHMSLVGPRPEQVAVSPVFESTVPGYRHRLRLPVGLTGLAQVHDLRGNTSLVERARFDNLYIEQWSLWLDVTIMARTVGAIYRQVLSSTRDRRNTLKRPAVSGGADAAPALDLAFDSKTRSDRIDA